MVDQKHKVFQHVSNEFIRLHLAISLISPEVYNVFRALTMPSQAIFFEKLRRGHYWVVFFSYFNVTYHILAGTLTLDGLSATRFIKDQSLGMNVLVNSYGLEQLTFSQISAEVTHPHFA